MTSYPVSYRNLDTSGGLSNPERRFSNSLRFDVKRQTLPANQNMPRRAALSAANQNKIFHRPVPLPMKTDVRLMNFSRAVGLSMAGQSLMNWSLQTSANAIYRGMIEGNPEDWGVMQNLTTPIAGWVRLAQCGGGGSIVFGETTSLYCGGLARTHTPAPAYVFNRWLQYYIGHRVAAWPPAYDYYPAQRFRKDVGSGYDTSQFPQVLEEINAHHWPDYQPATAAVSAMLVPQYHPWVAPAVQLDPFILPPMAPAPFPHAAPLWRRAPKPRLDPNRAPGEQPQRGPDTKPRVQRQLRGKIDLSGVTTIVNRPAANPKRPGPKTKERKFIVGLNKRSALGIALNFTTEGMDFVGAVWKGMPEHIVKKAGKRASFKEKLALIYLHWDQINLRHALDALVYNELEDRVYGAMGQWYAKANRNLSDYSGSRIQFQLGPAL